MWKQPTETDCTAPKNFLKIFWQIKESKSKSRKKLSTKSRKKLSTKSRNQRKKKRCPFFCVQIDVYVTWLLQDIRTKSRNRKRSSKKNGGKKRVTRKEYIDIAEKAGETVIFKKILKFLKQCKMNDMNNKKIFELLFDDFEITMKK